MPVALSALVIALVVVIAIVIAVLVALTQPTPSGHKLVITYNPPIGGNGMPLQMTDVQSTTASVAETDAKGNPVPVDPANPPQWAVADPAILTLTSNADGSATLAAAGKLGDCQVSVTVGGLSAQDIITVVAGAATTLNINFTPPA